MTKTTLQIEFDDNNGKSKSGKYKVGKIPNGAIYAKKSKS